MGTEFMALTIAEVESNIARGIVSREQEINSYETNIAVFQAIIDNPDSPNAVKERFRAQLITENQQRDVSIAIYTAMKSQIDPARLKAAVATAKVEFDATIAAAKAI